MMRYTNPPILYFTLLETQHKLQDFDMNKDYNNHYHVGKVNERIVDRNDLNSFLQRNTHHKTADAAKSSTHQISSNCCTVHVKCAVQCTTSLTHLQEENVTTLYGSKDKGHMHMLSSTLAHSHF